MLAFLFVLVVLALAVGAGGVWWLTYDLPDVATLLASQQTNQVMQTTRVYANDGRTLLFSHGRFEQKKAELDQISPKLIDALLATEDRRFYEHHGVDPLGIGRALIRNVNDKGMSEGASTITQQLTRTLFLSQERSIKRKVREMVLSWQLEDHLTKNEILERYLNTIYFGEGAYGIQAASTMFFNKPARDLTTTEAALLAGLPQAPSRLNPLINPEQAKKRRNEVLQNLVDYGKLSQAEADSLKERPLGLNPLPNRGNLGDRVPFFNRFLQQRIMSWYGLSEQEFWQAGFNIYTTLDLRAQQLAEAAVAEACAQFGHTRSKNEASLVALNGNDGALLAYVGGRDFGTSQYDKATQALRSPGSLFKVFTYTAALAQGLSPRDVMVDEPIQLGDWKPTNYSKSHAGAMTLAQAFAFSNNVIAVKVLHEIGADTVVSLAKRMGIESPLKPYLALTLGGSSVNLFEITGAINAIPNQGVWVKPYLVKRIDDSQGNTVYQHASQRRDVVAPTVANTMVRMMQGVVDYGTGQRAKFNRPVGGKSGTSDQHRDAWFVGFTPELTAGVWVGNTDNSTMPSSIAGGTLPATAWRLFSQRYLAPLPAKDFAIPQSITLPPDWFTSPPPRPEAEGVSLDGARIDLDSIPLPTTTSDDLFSGESASPQSQYVPPTPQGMAPPPPEANSPPSLYQPALPPPSASQGGYRLPSPNRQSEPNRLVIPPTPAPSPQRSSSGGGGGYPTQPSYMQQGAAPLPQSGEQQGAPTP
jgi:penicillin-binding protein 1A